MKVESHELIPDIKIFQFDEFEDERGSFVVNYNKKFFTDNGIDFNPIQENISYSRYNVFRGLHYQKNFPQAKFVRCLYGSIYDVIVDLRKDSHTYLKYIIIKIEENNAVFIPKNFAHGFYANNDMNIISYLIDEVYHNEDEDGLNILDNKLKIKIPQYDSCNRSYLDIKNAIINQRDKEWLFLEDRCDL